MTKKIYILAVFLILSIVIQIYLTNQYYSVNYGVNVGESVCNINETFNCDSVALSKYSNIYGVPNALLGVFLNIVLLIGLVGFLLNIDHEEKEQNYLDFLYNLSILSLISSLVLGFISFFIIKKVCIFCASLYLLSILTTVCIKLFFKAAAFNPLIFIKNKLFIGLLVFIPVGGLIGHKMIKAEYSPEQVELEIKSALDNWSSYKTLDTSDSAPAVFVKNKGGKFKLLEFADFLCPHCATASKSISTFLSLHPDVEFSFYTYPLDASCNAAMDPQYKGPGFSCTLAKGVFCAGKLENKASEMHYEIFDNQDQYRVTASRENNSGLITKMSAILSTSKDDFEKCINSEEAKNILLNHSKLGDKANIQGTPTVFFDGKKLPGGANFLMLQRAYNDLNR